MLLLVVFGAVVYTDTFPSSSDRCTRFSSRVGSRNGRVTFACHTVELRLGSYSCVRVTLLPTNPVVQGFRALIANAVAAACLSPLPAVAPA